MGGNGTRKYKPIRSQMAGISISTGKLWSTFTVLTLLSSSLTFNDLILFLNSTSSC